MIGHKVPELLEAVAVWVKARRAVKACSMDDPDGEWDRKYLELSSAQTRLYAIADEVVQ